MFGTYTPFGIKRHKTIDANVPIFFPQFKLRSRRHMWETKVQLLSQATLFQFSQMEV